MAPKLASVHRSREALAYSAFFSIRTNGCETAKRFTKVGVDCRPKEIVQSLELSG